MISRHFLTRVFVASISESFECLSSSEKPADTSDFQKQCGPATACLQLSSHKDRPVDALSRLCLSQHSRTVLTLQLHLNDSVAFPTLPSCGLTDSDVKPHTSQHIPFP